MTLSKSLSGPARSASLLITLFGAVTNFALAVQVLAAWRSIRWEPESSEWEGAAETWRIDGVKLVWGLLAAYFASAASVCFVGLVGIVKHIPSFVRFYRDYSIADFAFCTVATVGGVYAAFRPALRAGVCEELSRQPELMRDLGEMGLSLENCELWFERALLASMGLMTIVIVVRLHLLIAVSNYYSHLARGPRIPLPLHARSHSRQRIFLLPPATATSPEPSPDVLVYAPVPLASITPDARRGLTEAWIAREPRRHHHHHHSTASARSSCDSGETGRISLPIGPEEGLLPDYNEFPVKA